MATKKKAAKKAAKKPAKKAAKRRRQPSPTGTVGNQRG
jgi:hypothetical protein